MFVRLEMSVFTPGVAAGDGTDKRLFSEQLPPKGTPEEAAEVGECVIS